MNKRLRDDISRRFAAHPVLFSLSCMAYITVGRILCGIILLMFFDSSVNQRLSEAMWLHSFFNVDFALRYLFSIPAIYLIGIVTKTKGIRFVFSLKNFGKGLLILTPCIFVTLLATASSLYNDAVPGFTYSYFLYRLPLAVFNELGRGLFEEVLFRGVLMTAFLVSISESWSRNIKKRIVFVFVCGTFFGLIHFPADAYMAIFLISTGFLVCAAYVYSKNLLSCILVHAVSNIPAYYVSGWPHLPNWVLLLASVISFIVATYVTVMATPLNLKIE